MHATNSLNNRDSFYLLQRIAVNSFNKRKKHFSMFSTTLNFSKSINSNLQTTL